MTQLTHTNPTTTPRLDWARRALSGDNGHQAFSVPGRQSRPLRLATIRGRASKRKGYDRPSLWELLDQIIRSEEQKLVTPGVYHYSHGGTVVVTEDSELVKEARAKQNDQSKPV